MKGYAATIAEMAPGYDAGQIEAWMRLEFGTLDHLSREQFEREVGTAVGCIELAGTQESAALAASYGL